MIRGVRVLERLDELYAIGGGPGANRIGGSDEEQRAHDLAAGWMREAGLEVEVDPGGNLIGRTADPRVLTGSHLDSVPQGGKFDGALGVVAAIEAVERAGTVGINMPYTAFPGIPFGGYKQSGFGRELGLETLDLYLETKSVLVSTSPKPFNPFGL